MQWLIESIMAKIKAADDFCAWLGTDKDGQVRFYLGKAVAIENLSTDSKTLGTAANPLRYAVFTIAPRSGENLRFMDGSETRNYTMTVHFFERSTTSVLPCVEGERLFAAIWQLPASGQIDGLSTAEPKWSFHSLHVMADSDPTSPEPTVEGLWMMQRDFKIRLSATPVPTPTPTPTPTPP